MQRSDQKKTVHHEWEGNYNSWRHEVHDASTTELSGTYREADLIVRGLQTLRAQIILSEAVGVTSKYHADIHGSTMRPKGAPSLSEVEALLEAIKEPNYVGEPIVERS